jgi:hypothetical protein
MADRVPTVAKYGDAKFTTDDVPANGKVALVTGVTGAPSGVCWGREMRASPADYERSHSRAVI